MDLNAISTTDLFDAFTKTLCVGFDNVTLSFDSISDSLGSCSALVVNPINNLTGRPVESFLHLVQSPFRIFAFSESLPKVVNFLLEQLRLAAYCFGLRFDNGVQEGDGPILLVVLHCKHFGRVNTVDVLREALFVNFLVDDKGVIHIPAPEPGVCGAVLRTFCSKYSM